MQYSILCEKNTDLLELLLVNDGSTDGSGSICAKFAAQEPIIRVFTKENGGVASARNLGLKHARGQYIAWVDPDDCVSEEWFSEIRKAIAQGEPDVIIMDSLRFGAGEEKYEIYGRSGGFVDRDLFFKDVIRDIRMLSGLPNKVMKAELFENVWFDPALPILEDYAAIPHILKSAGSVYYIPQCLYRYRQHAKSLLHKTATSPFIAVQVALERGKIVENALSSAAVTAAAWQAFVFCRSYYLIPGFDAAPEQEVFCRQYIRKNLGVLLSDKEIRMLMKLKFILLSCNLYKTLACLKNIKHKR